MLQILFRIANYFLLYLRQINKKSILVEKSLYRSMRNRELIQLLALQKSLVYFSTSLKSNEITLEKLLKLEMVQKYEEDKDVLEDVIIETRQAIEMCNIYSDVLSGTMDAFASIISNNQKYGYEIFDFSHYSIIYSNINFWDVWNECWRSSI